MVTNVNLATFHRSATEVTCDFCYKNNYFHEAFISIPFTEFVYRCVVNKCTTTLLIHFVCRDRRLRKNLCNNMTLGVNNTLET